MKKIFLLLLSHLLVCTGYAQMSFDDKIAQILGNNEWFELRRLYEERRDPLKEPLLGMIIESHLHHNFNQPEEACVVIDSLLMTYQEALPMEVVMDLFFMKAANLSQMGFNKEAALTLSAVIEALTPDWSRDSLKGWFDMRSQYEALSQYEKVNQILIPHTDGIATFKLDSIGEGQNRGVLIIFNGQVNGQQQDILFSTGSMANVVNEETAKQLGLTILGAKGTIETGHKGESYATKLAFAREIILGNIVYRNVPFVIANQANDSIIANDPLKMILGTEFVKAAQEIQLDFDKRELRVPIFQTRISKGESRNLCGGLLCPLYVEAEVNGKTAMLFPDLGSTKSVMSDKFFCQNKDWITSHCKADTLRSMDFNGNVLTERGYNLQDFRLLLNGIPYTFPSIFVSTVDTPMNVKYGNIGTDYFTQFKKVIFNTKEMFMKVVKY